MKTKDEIAKVLKDYRQKTGLSATEVVKRLSLCDRTISPKTLYGWESGHSQPDADGLLLLCNIYGINDIMRAFGYSTPKICDTITTPPERTKLLDKIEWLDENNCKLISAYIDGLLAEPKGRLRG